MSRPAPTGPPSARWSALVGVVSGLVLVAIAELVSLAFSSSSAPFVAVGGAFVDIVPGALKDLVIGLFGTRDKLVLGISMLVVYAVLTGAAGLLGARRPVLGALVLVALGVFAGIMVVSRTQNTVADVIPTLLGTAVAVPSLLALLRAAGASPAPVTAAPSSAPSARSCAMRLRAPS